MPYRIETAGEALEALGVTTNYEELLGDLAWIYGVHRGRYLTLEATIKPDPNLALTGADPVELLAQLGASYSKIVAVLMEAGAAFARMPELTITGKAHTGPPGFHDIEARVRIELG